MEKNNQISGKKKTTFSKGEKKQDFLAWNWSFFINKSRAKSNSTKTIKLSKHFLVLVLKCS